MNALFEIARNIFAVIGLLVVAPFVVCVAYVTGLDVKEWLQHLWERRREERAALRQLRVDMAAFSRGAAYDVLGGDDD